MKRNKVIVVGAALFLLLSCGSIGTYCQSRSFDSASKLGQDRRTGDAIALVDGKTAITEKEVDEVIGAQLYNLQERIYSLRNQALQNLLIQRVLNNEARRRGISPEELRKQLMPDKVEVRQSDIDQRYADNISTLDNMDEDEAKQRIRLDLESRLKLDKYKAAIQEIMSRAKIEILLTEPAALASIINSDGPSTGTPGAPVTIIEFSDFQCPFCKDAAASMKKIMSNYGSVVRLIYKQLPLPIHTDAFNAARASVCADQQGAFWEYHDALFRSSDLSEQALNKYAFDLGIRTDQFKACLASETSAAVVRRDMQQAARADVQGTPTFFINGKLIRGMKSVEEFRALIDQALTRSRRESNRNSQQ